MGQRRKTPKTFICEHCDKEFKNKYHKKHLKFCSQKCHGKSKTGVNPFKDYSPWNKGKQGVQKYSKTTRLKMSKSHKGDKSYLWKGGITKLNFKIRELFEYKDWRVQIFKRDSYTCQACKDNTGGNLVAHHILHFSKILKKYNIKNIKDSLKCSILWDISNGITLCRKCHKLEHPTLKFI